MLFNVDTHANSVTESSFALMKFMEVQMNVYLPYSFNCWRNWMCILRKWTTKGVFDFDILTVVVILREIYVEKRTKIPKQHSSWNTQPYLLTNPSIG